MILRFIKLINLLFLIGCTNNNKNSADQFELVKSNFKENKYYSYSDLAKFTLNKKVVNLSNGLEFNFLCDTSTHKKDFQYLLEIKNKQNDIFFIPFPSNALREYWNFEYDKYPDLHQSNENTFENELNKSLIGLCSKQYSEFDLIKDVFEQILCCREIKNYELKFINQFRYHSNKAIDYLGYEDYYENDKMSDSIFKFIKSDSSYQKFIDEENHRIYAIKYPDFVFPKRACKIKLKVFRIDFRHREISL